jgi:hypothetical protein
MSLEIAGLKFYIELDEHGKPVTTLPAGVLRIYRDATLYDDTVQVISAIVLTVPAGPKTRLEGNAKLRRLFSHGSETYALHLGEPRLRGWVSLDRAKENVTWRVLQPTSVRGIPSSVADRIASRINDTNRRLQSLYELFSRESGIPRESPRWQIRKNDDGILCILAGDSVFHQQSTRLLAREFGGFLIGTNLHVTIHPGRIEINERR